jgi:hypothetical protein
MLFVFAALIGAGCLHTNDSRKLLVSITDGERFIGEDLAVGIPSSAFVFTAAFAGHLDAITEDAIPVIVRNNSNRELLWTSSRQLWTVELLTQKGTEAPRRHHRYPVTLVPPSRPEFFSLAPRSETNFAIHVGPDLRQYHLSRGATYRMKISYEPAIVLPSSDFALNGKYHNLLNNLALFTNSLEIITPSILVH